jgi:hypothetical protein
MSLLSATSGLTAVLTVLATFVLASGVGAGFLIYLAMLGPSALWLLPGLLAQTIPAGVAGGILMAGANTEADRRPSPRDAAILTIVLAAATLYFVGWAVPDAYERTGAVADRFTKSRAVEATQAKPVSAARMPLPELLADSSAAARAEMWTRLQAVARTLIFGLAAAFLLVTPLRWNVGSALVVTAVLFLWQMHGLTALANGAGS